MQFCRISAKTITILKRIKVKLPSYWKNAFFSDVGDTAKNLMEFSVCLEKIESLVNLGILPQDVWKYLSIPRQVKGMGPESSLPLSAKRQVGEEPSINRAVVEQVNFGTSRGKRTSRSIEEALSVVRGNHPKKISRSKQKAASELLRLWQDLSVCWGIAENYGIPLTSVLGVSHEHAEDRIHREYRRITSMAGPVMSTKIMLALPFAALIMTSCAGMGTIDFLLRTLGGWLCLLGAGVSLLAARKWVSRLLANVQASSTADEKLRRNVLKRRCTPDRWGKPPGSINGRARRSVLADIALVIDLVGGLLECGMNLDHALKALTPYVERDIMFKIKGNETDKKEERQCAELLELETAASVLELTRSVGVPSRKMLASHARWLRRKRRYDMERKIEALGVKIVLPLGICVLPAFFCLAIFPVMAVLANGIF